MSPKTITSPKCQQIVFEGPDVDLGKFPIQTCRPEGCSYRMAVVSIKKSYPGYAARIMMGIWSFLRQFMYTKFIVVDDIDPRNWNDVIWAMTTRMDPC